MPGHACRQIQVARKGGTLGNIHGVSASLLTGPSLAFARQQRKQRFFSIAQIAMHTLLLLGFSCVCVTTAFVSPSLGWNVVSAVPKTVRWQGLFRQGFDAEHSEAIWDGTSSRGKRRRRQQTPPWGRRNPPLERRSSSLGAESDSYSVNGYGSSPDLSTASVSMEPGSGLVLTPYQILYPPFFTSIVSGNDITLPLHSALTIMTKALDKIADGTVAVSDLSAQDSGFKERVRSDGAVPEIIRIDQRLNHEVDPLCWLHANAASLPHETPTLFLADAEGTSEAAVVGSAAVLSLGGVTEEGEEQKRQNFWDVVRKLPGGSRVYGASRFDANLDEAVRGEEWSAWGDGFWVLPSFEVRRERLPDPSASSDSPSFDGGDGSRSPSSGSTARGGRTTITVSIHLYTGDGIPSPSSIRTAAHRALQDLRHLSSATSAGVPPTTLPPVVSRDYNVGGTDSQEVFERAVDAALDTFGDNDGDTDKGKDGLKGLQKVVLARRLDLHLGTSVVSGLDVMRMLKFGGHVGHLFYVNPGGGRGAFLGCSPERLFQIDGADGTVRSEALAGTRPRGSTPEADADLLKDLIASRKDRAENVITGRAIREAFQELRRKGLLLPAETGSLDSLSGRISVHEKEHSMAGTRGSNEMEGEGTFFVRRLRHLQHLCQSLEGRLSEKSDVMDVGKFLLQSLHPTPAVGGYPQRDALAFIRHLESPSFDRGYYAGPCGYVGADSADIVVAIRSALLSGGASSTWEDNVTVRKPARLSVYAGAGIVPGSTVQGEWAETSHKLGVVSSLFPPSPFTLQSSPTPNAAWASAFVEELVRCGVTQFYICPGSRSTPLTAAVAKAIRMNVGVVHGLSVHDERGAGFRALGYGRGTNRPAAVITSSGTAVANLYPAIMEAGMDAVPLLVLTADRPYENRDTGANQAVDQVKAFSSTYIRWFRDVPPPTDDVPISIALSDANHAVTMSQKLMGPVHLNIQFRENLAPDSGPIRSDNRVGSVTKMNTNRFTDVPGFHRWATGGGTWLKSYYSSHDAAASSHAGSFGTAVVELVDLIMKSQRGIIVVGNIRGSNPEEMKAEGSTVTGVVSNLAQAIGFPIFAGIQTGSLRHESPAVVPFAEHILKHPTVSKSLKPDLILQIGAPLISTEISNMIAETMKRREQEQIEGVLPIGVDHVLLHPHHPSERSDPHFTVTHRISAEVGPFLEAVIAQLEGRCATGGRCSSSLSPLVLLGQALEEEMPQLIHQATDNVVWCKTERNSNSENESDAAHGTVEDEGCEPPTGTMPVLSEPQVVLAISEVMNELPSDNSLFLSNSMPVRDAESFLYPSMWKQKKKETNASGTSFVGECGGPYSVAVNRGASGIDGIISTATGFADASERPVTLLCGDVAMLHDLNALHTLSRHPAASSPNSPSHVASSASHRVPLLTTVIVNNDGGGIFSFLPISKHGSDVGFDEFFGTPTNSFSFNAGADAFGLPFKSASSYEAFKNIYRDAVISRRSSIVEAQVVGREVNVAVHAEISKLALRKIDEFIDYEQGPHTQNTELPIKLYTRDNVGAFPRRMLKQEKKTLLLLHGWMGDKTEWDDVGASLVDALPDWTIVAVDLPGHGDSPFLTSEPFHAVRRALGLTINKGSEEEGGEAEGMVSVDAMAAVVLRSLAEDYGIQSIGAVCGYSLGGRIAMAMKRLCSAPTESDDVGNAFGGAKSRSPPILITEETKMLLLGSYPGEMPLARDKMDTMEKLSTTSIQPDVGTIVKTVRADSRKARAAADDDLSRVMESAWNRSYLLPTSASTSSLVWSPFLSRWYGAALWGKLQEERPVEYKKMISRRLQALSLRGHDLAVVLRHCSPSRSPDSDWKSLNPYKAAFVAGSHDEKYTAIGRQWAGTVSGIQFVQVKNAGHALLVEAPVQVARIMSKFLANDVIPGVPPHSTNTVPRIEDHQSDGSSAQLPGQSTKQNVSDVQHRGSKTSTEKATAEGMPLPAMSTQPDFGELGSLDYEMFSVDLFSDDRKKNGVLGIGWGDKAALRIDNKLNQRSGFVLNLVSPDGSMVGIGEASPLEGLHQETIDEAEKQLSTVKEGLKNLPNVPTFDAAKILAMDGSLTAFLDSLATAMGISALVPSVRSGLEMALLSLASQVCRVPILQALGKHSPENHSSRHVASSNCMLPLNGLITRGSAGPAVKPAQRVGLGQSGDSGISYQSLKVKVGHQGAEDDARALSQGLQAVGGSKDHRGGRIRADANRAWTEAGALDFANALDRLEVNSLAHVEFIEEPIQKQYKPNKHWSFALQLRSLESWHSKTGIKYALDESLADIAAAHGYDFDGIVGPLRQALSTEGHAGCAAFVLKPAVLGLEVSMRLARVANELGIGSVFSSSFDSGVGLAYAAFLGAVSDASPHYTSSKYAHGLGTFSMLGRDTLSPPFASYVNENGMLKVASLSRALYGLGLDELRESLAIESSNNDFEEFLLPAAKQAEEYQASASTSSSGREISVQASLPLPFSDDVACARFTDLPQMSRWSPWLNSVAYLDAGETEWTLNVRGVRFSWRAVSTIIKEPKGIMWESVSGLKNLGIVEFIPTSEASCVMKVNLSLITPRIVAALFHGTSIFIEDFLQNKLLKWSLEMFRDVVKADLALERGDVELGDALFGAVEGRANAIEATLSYEGRNNSISEE